MMVKPTVSELLDKIGDNRYSLIIMASRRARQIASGAERLVETDSTSPVTIAAEEIAAGKVKAVSDEEETKE